MANNVEARAMKLAYEFFGKNGWNPEDVSHASGVHAGYDIFIQKDSRKLKVEVKGSQAPYKGIPDLYDTQVDECKVLVADFLFVAYFPENAPEKFAIIPRDHFLSDAFDARIHYCIKSKYKNLEFISEHLIDTNEPWHG